MNPADFQFDFVDAPHPSHPAFGVDIFFPPPNYTFWKGVDPSSVEDAHRWLRAYFDAHGTYDAVMCFSQGCALISSFVLHHNNEDPGEPLPFRAAVFICGGIPLQMLADLGLPVSEHAWTINKATGKQLHELAGSAADEIRALIAAGRNTEHKGLWDKTERLQHDVQDRNFPPDASDVFGLDLTRFPDGLKIDMPTVHVYGIKDPRYPASIQLAHFSNPDRRRVFDHGGGHEIPRTTAVSQKIASLLIWLQGELGVI